eukprot:716665-Rhodomonas_salina.1
MGVSTLDQRGRTSMKLKVRKLKAQMRFPSTIDNRHQPPRKERNSCDEAPQMPTNVACCSNES